MSLPLSARQIIYRGILSQAIPHLSNQELDNLLRSIDSDLQVPLRLDASATPDLVVTVNSAIVSNPESNRQRSIPHIGNNLPTFAGGTITFPAADGGNITTSDGGSVALNIPSGQYVKVLVSLSAAGALVVTPGSSDVAEANAAVPAPVPNTLPIGYIVLHNNGGTIENIQQSKIFQFGVGGGSGGSGSQAGFAQEVNIPAGATELTVAFPSALPGNNYVLTPQLVNLTDADPQFQDVTVTQKTANGFTVKWNAPTDSANYKLAYIVPAVQEQVGEVNVAAGATERVVSLPIALTGVDYSVICDLVNLVDTDPQFQSVTVTSKTTTEFTVKWNAPTDSANYRLAFRVANFQ